MAASKIDEVTKGMRRIKRQLAKSGVAAERLKLMDATIRNCAWIENKLEQAKKLIGDADVIIEYDNGGGQTGIRENPAIKAYEALWKSYLSGINSITSAIPEAKADDLVNEADKPSNVLSIVRAKRKADA